MQCLEPKAPLYFMSDFAFLNEHRIRVGHYRSTPSDGFNGMFEFALPGEARRIRCLASDGSGLEGTVIESKPKWQHVSVSFGPNAKTTPSWKLMCRIKDLFWDENDVVVQFHPAKSEYVNFHPHCLHLWRSLDQPQPIPPSIYVGPKL